MMNETHHPHSISNASVEEWSQEIAELASQLMTGESVTLTAVQTKLLHEAIRRSAADQIHIAKLQRRLERYARSAEDLEVQAEAIVNRLLERAHGPSVDDGFSYEDVRRVRQEVAQSIERAGNGADVLIAVLTAAMRVLPLL